MASSTGSATITLQAGSPVANATFSADGTALIAACYDATIKTWRAESFHRGP